jgi:hypothetical protein
VITREGESVQNWMCGKCNALHDWFTCTTACCGVRSVGAYSQLRCPLCLDDLPGWNLYDDGFTRPCVCSPKCVAGALPAQPNPDQRNATSAYVLGVIAKSLVPSCRFPTIVPRRPAARFTCVGTKETK